MLQVAPTVTLDEVHAFARSFFSFVADYGREPEVAADAAAVPGKYCTLGPIRTTSIIACVPTFVTKDGEAIEGGISARAGASPRSLHKLNTAAHCLCSRKQRAKPVGGNRGLCARGGRCVWCHLSRLLTQQTSQLLSSPMCFPFRFGFPSTGHSGGTSTPPPSLEP